MGTKTIVYVLIFDIMIALLSGAYTHVLAPPIVTPPSYSQIEQQIAKSNISYTTPRIVLIGKFNVSQIGLYFPGLVIPNVTLFKFSLAPLAPILAPIVYALYFIWYVLQVFFSTIFWLFSIFTSTIYLVGSIPVVGPFLLAIFFVVNFIIIWEILKLVRGYGP